MNVKKFAATLSFVAFGAMSLIYAQTFNSGDKELDGSLLEINAQAKLDLNTFKIGLKAEFNLTTEKATIMLKTMEPADLYMVVLVSKCAGKPVDLVTTSYAKNKGKGWGVIAKEMGIKPGSKAFHELKNSAKGKHEKMKAGKGKPASQKVKANPKPSGTPEIKETPSKASGKAKVAPAKASPGKGKGN